MRSFTCNGPCGRTYRVHLGPVPRDRVCSGCRFPVAPAPTPATPAPVAPLRFADLDPGERRLYRGTARVKLAG
jgi:hypothetical protein